MASTLVASCSVRSEALVTSHWRSRVAERVEVDQFADARERDVLNLADEMERDQQIDQNLEGHTSNTAGGATHEGLTV